MSDEKLDFTADQAERVANKVDAVAGRIKAVLETMKTEHAARYGCWGADKTGNKFAHGDNKNGYVEGMANQQKVIDSYPEFLSGSKGYSPEFRKAARLLTAVENGNRLGIERTVRFKA
ncbi:hypothetical protein [Nocardia grenadensis]|uniref:hypothetical protein n=1 Tax=Nocardia grenadensis TaxID=931537 RepID=UPI0007A4C3B1|nr:hypothetical protein [Nocardia grenadensis]